MTGRRVGNVLPFRRRPIGPDDVHVRMKVASVCHSDLHAWNQDVDADLPLVMGHEGAGEVIEVGEHATNLHPGDRVMVSMVPRCATCRNCSNGQPSLCLQTADLRSRSSFGLDAGTAAPGFIGLGTFAHEIVVPSAALVKAPDDVAYEHLSLLSCGFLTGFGSIANAGAITPGDSVLVVGCGVVGLAAIQTARALGAGEIIATDLRQDKLDMAAEAGATRLAQPEDLEREVRTATVDGVDISLDAAGAGTTAATCWQLTRRGGRVVIAAGVADQQVVFDGRDLFVSGKSLIGTVYGSVDTSQDLDRVVELMRAGELDLDSLIGQRIELDELPDAFERTESGSTVRQVLHFA